MFITGLRATWKTLTHQYDHQLKERLEMSEHRDHFVSID